MPRTPKPPRLKPIPLVLEGPEGCDNPYISDSKYYLVRYRREWYAGQFERVWYGWNFEAIYDAGTQLNDPDIRAIFEIIPQKRRKK